MAFRSRRKSFHKGKRTVCRRCGGSVRRRRNRCKKCGEPRQKD